MLIRVKGYLTLQQSLGECAVELREGDTLRILLARIAVEAGESVVTELIDDVGRPRDHVTILVDGRGYKQLPDGLETRLKNGDEVAIFPPIMGG